MKRGTTPELKVRLYIDNASTASVTFVFKQTMEEDATALVTKTWTSAEDDDVTYDSERECYLIEWTEAETRLFVANQVFFMDTKPVLTSGKIPETPIVMLKMNPTLFEEEEDDD